MMKYIPVLASLFSLVLAGCDNGNNQTQETVKQPAQPTFITDKSVWQGNLDKCRDSESVDNCFMNEVKNTGTAEALKAAQYLAEKGETGYISAYRKEGPVGIADIEYPFRANTNSGTLLVPSEGQPIDIDDITNALKTFPAWQDFQKQHPDAAPWPPGTLSKKQQTNDGLDFVFSYPVQTCHACEKLGSLSISYKFTPDGKFMESKAIEIK